MAMFLDSEMALADFIAGEVKVQIIDPLLALNFPNADKMDARIEWAGIGKTNVDQIVNAAAKLGLSGFLTFNPETYENYFRELLDMPIAEETPGGKEKPEEKETPEDDPEEQDQPKKASEGSCRVHLLDDTEAVLAPQSADGFWRPLRPEENVMALAEIKGHGDDAKRIIRSIIDKLKSRWIESLKEQVAEALRDGDPSDVGDIAIPAELLKPLLNETVGIFKDLFRYGKQTVDDEYRRQKRMARLTEMSLRDMPPESKEVTDMFWVRGRQFLTRLSSKVENRAKDLALTLYRQKKTAFDSIDLDQLAVDILGTLDSAARLEASVLVNEAFNMGRSAEADEYRDEIQTVVYTAILDENLCDPCHASDGMEVVFESEEYYDNEPPNRNCAGGDRCRCMYVFIFA
jgi:hypothetical protein